MPTRAEMTKKATDHLGYLGFARVVVEALCRVPSRPEPASQFADEMWETELPSDLSGRVYAITGASNGMGKHLALKLAERGATVIMLNRKSAHSQAAFEHVRDAAAAAAKEKNFNINEAGAVHLVDCDLCDFASVRRAAEQIHEITSDLDALICNAGVMALDDVRTVDGYDVQVQANHLSHFLLTSLLLDTLVATGKKRGEPARIVSHSSNARLFVDKTYADCFEKEWVMLEDGHVRGGDESGKWARYHQSKRLNVGFTYALADYIERSGAEDHVIAVCAQPGAVNSGLQARTAGSSFQDNLSNGIAVCCGMSTADGALGMALATLKPGVQNGALYGPAWCEFVGNAGLMESERHFYDQDQLDLIWQGSLRCTGAQF